MGSRLIVRLRYVQEFRDRYGKSRLYFRRKGFPRIALPPRNDPTFHAAYAKALAATSGGGQVTTSRVPPGSLEALSRLYFTNASFKQLGQSTQRVYRRIILDLCRKHGEKPVALLGEAQARRILDAKADTPAAANHVLRTLRALMKHALAERWITVDPTRDLGRLRERGQGAETWTEADIAAFEARWPTGTRERLAMALLLYTGQRRSDVVRMGRQHVRDGAIEVRQVKSQGKTQLIIPLHPELAGMIAAEKDRLTFLVTEQGKPFTPNGFYMRFKGWCAAAGLPADRSPHGLRKAAARRLAEAGCTAHQIAAITGHKTLGEVQRYTRAADQERLARDALARITRPRNGNGVV